MKNMPPSPLPLDFASLLLARLDGSSISKAPKKDAAKIMNTTKNIRFGSQCVASQLNMSAVTVFPPIIHVRPMITLIGTVYKRTMKRP